MRIHCRTFCPVPIKCPKCGNRENGGRTIIHAQSCPKYLPLAWENRRNIVAYNALCRSPECIALFPNHGKELWRGPEPIINTLKAEEP